MYGVYIRKKCKTLQAKRIVFIIHLSKGGVIYDGKEKKKSELISYILEKTGCKPEETVYIEPNTKYEIIGEMELIKA